MTKDEIIALACEIWGVNAFSQPAADRITKLVELATRKERIARKAAQIENELLKDVLAGAAMKERRAVWAERKACAKVLQDRAVWCEAEARHHSEGGERDEAISLRALAWHFSVCRNEIIDMGRA